MSFLDYNGALVPYTYEAWKDEKQSEKRDNRTPTKNPNRMSPTLSGNQDSFSDRQFIVITSEKQARVVALPSQNCVYRQQIADTDYVIKAEIISFKVCYLSTGHLMAFSLPSLRPLMDVDFLPLADLRYVPSLISSFSFLIFIHILNYEKKNTIFITFLTALIG
uniref:Uncharacterized protein n=1 Tax=Phlebotomus papatasi TaxID=29031 RepID=A0A1B0DHT0_PHLPP